MTAGAARASGKRGALALFLGPGAALIVVFYLVPVVLTFVIAATDMGRDLAFDWVGPRNLVRLWESGDPLLPRILVNTIVYVALGLPLTIVGGLAIAILTAGLGTAGIVFRTLFFVPRMLPPVVWGFLWSWAFEGTRYGIANEALTALGGEPVSWLTRYPMTIVVAANASLGMALAILVFSSAMATIPADRYRAAEVDGASRWQVVRFVVLPALKWPIVTMTAWHLMSYMNSYVYIMLITGGGPYHATEVWSLYAYKLAFEQYRYGYGAMLTAVLVAANLLLLFATLRLFGTRRMLKRDRGVG